MTMNNFIIVCLALTIVTIGTLILPNTGDHISSLIKDHAYGPALKLAENRHAAGDQNPKVLNALYQLRSYFGDIEGATTALEQLAAQQPKNIGVQMQLAEHYKSTQRIDRYISVLEKIVGYDITQPVAHMLLGYYRYLGNVEVETRLIKRLIKANHAAPSLIGRLGMLLLSQGELAEATRLLILFDDGTSISMRTERLALFELLIERGQYDQAYERAVRWTKSWRDPDATQYLAERFRIAGKNTSAQRLIDSSHVLSLH